MIRGHGEGRVRRSLEGLDQEGQVVHAGWGGIRLGVRWSMFWGSGSMWSLAQVVHGSGVRWLIVQGGRNRPKALGGLWSKGSGDPWFRRFKGV